MQKTQVPENEIRVASRGGIQGCISRAADLLLREDEPFDSVNIRGAGDAISKVCRIAFILRWRIPGLHQLNKIFSTEIDEDRYDDRRRRRRDDRDEDDDEEPRKRRLIIMEVRLYKSDKDLDVNDIGYQGPLPEDQVEELSLEKLTSHRGNEGGDRGGYGNRRRSYGDGGRRRYGGGGGGRRRYDDRRGGDRRGGDRRGIR